MFFLSLFICAKSIIPYKYRTLVDEALKSAEIKTPKEVRENTKYPGVYESDRYHFKLTKTLTNKRTNDVKGFSFNENNCAIVKRKKFNLTDGFAVVDPLTQNIFLLKKSIAEENKVIVYESKKINIFHIMTDFVLETSSDHEINDLPIKSILRSSKRPKAEIKFSHRWDDLIDRPEMQPVQDGVKVGAGYAINIGISTKLSFKSIWDISISFRLNFEGKFGAEVVIPDDSEIFIDGFTLFSKKIAIPSLGFIAEFLGIEISIGAFMNFVLEIVDIKISIPLGFDYFKGYKLSATKYFEITPSSITDSKWETNLIELPEVDSMKDVFKSFQQSKFSATVQIRPFVSLEFNIGSFGSQLECGLKFPVVFDFSFNKELCNYPHLKADLSMPIKMYFAFRGIYFDKYMLIKPAEKEILLLLIKLPSFCVGGKRLVTEDTSFDPGSNAMFITVDEAYEVRSGNARNVAKEIALSFVDENNVKLDEQVVPYLNYYDSTNKRDHIKFFVFLNYKVTDLQASLKYIDSLNIYRSDDIFSKKVSEMKFDNNKVLSLPVELRKSKNDNSDITKMKLNIKKVYVQYLDEVYTRRTEWVLIHFNDLSINEYNLFVIDDQGNREVDHNATFLSYYATSEIFAKTGPIFTCDLNDWFIHICKTTIKENNIKVRFSIYKFYIKDGAYTSILLCTIQTPTLNIGDDFSKTLEGQKKYQVYLEDTDILYLYSWVYRGNTYEHLIYKFPDFRQNNYHYINFPLTKNNTVNFNFTCEQAQTDFLVKTSKTNPFPAYETVMSVVDVDSWTYENYTDIIFKMLLVWNEFETTKMLKFSIPEEHLHDKIYIVIQKADSETNFLDDRVTRFQAGIYIIDIGGNSTLELPLIRGREDYLDTTALYHYIQFPPSGMIMVPDGTPIVAKMNIGTFVLVPDYYATASFVCEIQDGDNAKYTTDHFENYTAFVFFAVHEDGDEFILYMNSTGLGEDEPSIEANITNLQSYVKKNGELIYSVYARNGVKIRARINGTKNGAKTLDDENEEGESIFVDLVDQKATFVFKENLGDIVFTTICANETEKGCEIKYPEPSETGYHLIKYPNRWGISTTGRGFLSELIPVQKGKSFYYYKTYEGAIEKVREYSSKPASITFKIIDQRNANYENMKRTRTLCLEDEKGNVIPFSRQFVNDDLFNFLESVGISTDIDMNFLLNDEEGRIIFDPQYITSNDFSNVTPKVCDMKLENNKISKVDKSDLIFDVGGVDRQQMRRTIILLVVILLIVLAIIGLIIFCNVRKCRKKKKQKELERELEEQMIQEELARKKKAKFYPSEDSCSTNDYYSDMLSEFDSELGKEQKAPKEEEAKQEENEEEEEKKDFKQKIMSFVFKDKTKRKKKKKNKKKKKKDKDDDDKAKKEEKDDKKGKKQKKGKKDKKKEKEANIENITDDDENSEDDFNLDEDVKYEGDGLEDLRQAVSDARHELAENAHNDSEPERYEHEDLGYLFDNFSVSSENSDL